MDGEKYLSANSDEYKWSYISSDIIVKLVAC